MFLRFFLSIFSFIVTLRSEDIITWNFHVFSYSERKFARRKKFDDPVAIQTIKERSKRLRGISDKKRAAFMKRFLGRSEHVLFEQKKHGYWTGLTDNYLKVIVKTEDDLNNTLKPVTFSTIDKTSIFGVCQWLRKRKYSLKPMGVRWMFMIQSW